MNHMVQSQHPAVVLRSNYNHLRTLLAVAMIAVVGLSGAVVILATNEDGVSTPTARSVDVATTPALPANTRYDGGPEEGTRGVSTAAASPGVRYDGGPEEGTRGLSRAASQPATATSIPDSRTGTRYDGGPNEGTRGPFAASSAPSTRYDGGPEEGSRGIGR